MTPTAAKRMPSSAYRVRLFLLILLFPILGGCATMDKVTGRDNLNAEIQRLHQRNEQLQATISQMEKSLSIEKARGKGIKMIFFGGDIIYEIDGISYADFRAGLRLRALRDPVFARGYEQYESGGGGDSQVLALLKEIDLSMDRIVDVSEGASFRKEEEAIFYQAGRSRY